MTLLASTAIAPFAMCNPSQSRLYSPVAVGGVLLFSVSYLSAISFLNAQGLRASPALVGLFELALLTACLACLWRKIPLGLLLLIAGLIVWLSIAGYLRQQFDIKGLRDLLIPVLFVCLGRQVADIGFADRTFKRVLLVVAAVGLFEALFLDAYARMFNTFSFYLNLGQIREQSAMFAGQMLTLNGFRPEGIGRTILPSLLGNHRISSLLMDPVSLGNLAVIALAWGLSKETFEWRRALPFIAMGVLLMTLADSRFGLMMLGVLCSMRLLPARALHWTAPLLPLLAFAVVMAVPMIMPSVSDDFAGRLSRSGMAVWAFDLPMLLGVGNLPNFGDMGYAYILSRFGLPLCVLLLAGISLLPAADRRGMRFRAFLMAYLSLILSVSGTSVFAFKTAAMLWFLMGVLTVLPVVTREDRAEARLP